MCQYPTERDQPLLASPTNQGLENHCGGNVTVGSNPTPSALGYRQNCRCRTDRTVPVTVSVCACGV
jgi:hypothetical protein